MHSFQSPFQKHLLWLFQSEALLDFLIFSIIESSLHLWPKSLQNQLGPGQPKHRLINIVLIVYSIILLNFFQHFNVLEALILISRFNLHVLKQQYLAQSGHYQCRIFVSSIPSTRQAEPPGRWH